MSSDFSFVEKLKGFAESKGVSLSRDFEGFDGLD